MYIVCGMTVTRQSTSSIPLLTDLSISRVPLIILYLNQLVMCLLRAFEDRRTSSKWPIGGGYPEAK